MRREDTMSTLTLEPTKEKEQETTGHTETADGTRAAFTQQTGQALLALGTLFKHVPPFNESIEQSTSDTLISLGKKLKGMK